ncbi:MAG TPA: hypothetical protein VHP34_06455 [Alphaproteobacteria bacterium]|nr:hypothetical protein [Alphaproteobacteria bacterium]
MGKADKNTKKSGARQQTALRRFGFWTVFKKIIFTLFGTYLFIYSFNAGFHPNRVPEILKPSVTQLFVPDIYAAERARLSLLRSLYKVFPKGTPLSEVKSVLATLGFVLSGYDATYKSNNFICTITYRVVWEVDNTTNAITKFNGGANMKCGINS